MSHGISDVEALLFDVFGTVVDWRTSVIREVDAVSAHLGWKLDAAELTDAWRGRYGPSMDRVVNGDVPYANLDALHRTTLTDLLGERGVHADEAIVDRLATAWHRLEPWPDSVEGLTRLKRSYVIGTMSNGSIALLTNMAKRAGLPWDVILSPELMRTYKSNLKSYEYAISLLGLEPHQTMMVAAHAHELDRVMALGMRTAYVPRPAEYGRWDESVLSTEVSVDVRCRDLVDLADQLAMQTSDRPA